MTRLKRQLKEETGSVLVVVLGAIIVASLFGTAITLSTGNNISQSVRDGGSKRAIAAAEAGAQEAAYRMNMLQPTSSLPCATVSSGVFVKSAAGGNGWCAAQTVTLGPNSSASYQVGPYVYNNGIVNRDIVSTGTVKGVSRRIKISVSANTGAPLFEAYGLSSDLTLTLSGNASVTNSARSNGNIVMNGNARICPNTANAIAGPGKQVQTTGNATVCGQKLVAAAPFVITPVDQGDAVTNNDNGRLFGQDPKTGTVSWSASTKQLSMSGNSTLTLGGHTYSLCKLDLSGNSQLTIAANATVRIFINSPAACGLADSASQLSMSGNTKVINTSQDPTHLQIYLIGPSGATMNSASMSGNAASQLTFYAPATNLSISGNGAAYTGALVSKQISISGNGATITYDSRVASITQSTTGVYRQLRYVECSSSNSSSTPDNNC